MYAGKTFKFEKQTQIQDIDGSLIKNWVPAFSLDDGYLDMLTGTNRSFTEQSAIVQESTHVLVFLDWYSQIDDNMRVIGPDGSVYVVTYVDDPTGIEHHSEIYLKRLVKVGG